VTILITGATGLLGSHLVERLQNRRVVVLVRDVDMQSEYFRSKYGNHIIEVRGDLSDSGLIERVIVQYEVSQVFHLGAQTLVGCGLRLPLETFESNIRGTYLLLEACRMHMDLVKHVVIASSDKAYGTSLKLPYIEEMPLHGSSPYDVSKSCCDLLAQSYLRTYKLPVAIARCGNLFGGGDLNFSRLIPGTIQSLLDGKVPEIRSDGTYLRDYLYVKDAVSGYLMLAEKRLGGAFNFGPGQPRSVLAVVNSISEIMGSLVEPIILDEVRGEIRDQYLDSTKARRVLGWEPEYTFKEALLETVEWYSKVMSETR